MRKQSVLMVSLVLSLVLVLYVTAVPAFGQEVTATIVGTVTDPSGAAVAGASVTAKDMDRGTVWTSTTNETGSFNIPRLPVGTYEVKVSASGFQAAAHTPITLVLNQSARLDFQMRVGQASETVEVTSIAPTLKTETVEVDTILSARTNDNLPLATRNPVQLTLLAPGAVTVDTA